MFLVLLVWDTPALPVCRCIDVPVFCRMWSCNILLSSAIIIYLDSVHNLPTKFISEWKYSLGQKQENSLESKLNFRVGRCFAKLESYDKSTQLEYINHFVGALTAILLIVVRSIELLLGAVRVCLVLKPSLLNHFLGFVYTFRNKQLLT